MDYRTQRISDELGRKSINSRTIMVGDFTEIQRTNFAAVEISSARFSAIAAIPEEAIWLKKLKSKHTRRAYLNDVRHFMRVVGITTQAELRCVTHKHVTLWDEYMREHELPSPSSATIRRRLSALSSLFKHLIRQTDVEVNPVREITRPPADNEGQTPAFNRKEARKVLNSPVEDTVAGLRDRAVLSVGFQAGLRREEIAKLRVRDLHSTRGFDALRVRGKRRKRRTIIINAQTAHRVRVYLAAAGHAEDLHGPMFRAVGNNGHSVDNRRHMSGEQIARIARKYAACVGRMHGYASHSMRATWVTTALENGADIKDVSKDAGHSDVSTTERYDRRGQNPEKSAAFFATY